MAYDVELIRKDFPLLAKKGAPVYFDNACMSLRPQQVVGAITGYYNEYPACGSRSMHQLGKRVDEEVFMARKTVRKFVGAGKDKEIIFLRNTTEAINLVARAYPFNKGEVILISDKEHNSNLLPWQVLAQRKGLSLEVFSSNVDNSFSMENFENAIEQHHSKISMVALGHTSNLDGVTVPAQEIIKKAHKHGIKVMLDAAQSAPHQELKIKALGADYVAFSGHKMLGPSGIGVLTGTQKALETLRHDNVGGETVSDSTYSSAKWEGLPHKFEAGLQNYPGIIGLGAAANYLAKLKMKNIQKHDEDLNTYLTELISVIPGLDIIGPKDAKLRGGITNFTIKGMNAHDIATLLDASKNIMIRSGAHCVHSWYNKRGIPGSARASMYLYNTDKEVETFANELKSVAKVKK